MAITLIHPSWSVVVTDWLRAGLAWPELLVAALVSWWFTRTRQPWARAWWMVSAAMLAYALGQNLWVVLSHFVYRSGVPVPSWADLGFLMQYPFFLLALVFWPSGSAQPQRGIIRVRMLLDILILMGAATALSWYFILAPLYLRSNEPLLGKATNMAYPVGDLAVLFALVLTLLPLRHGTCRAERPSLVLLLAAITCLIVADSWFTSIDLSGVYVTSGWPDVFWMSCYLLVSLAALVQMQGHLYPSAEEAAKATAGPQPAFQREDILEALRFLLPLVATLLAGGVILSRDLFFPVPSIHRMIPLLVVFLLALLVVIRQGILVLEHARLSREHAAARTREEVTSETNRRMDRFLSIASHELRTPLTTLTLQVQMAERRLTQVQSVSALVPVEATSGLESIREYLSNTEAQIARLSRLIYELLDDSRVQAGRLDLYRKPGDLAALVRGAVEEQRQMVPERTMTLDLPPEPLARIAMDADRIGQVVTNYLTNALKYSQPASPVEVGLRQDADQAFVWVRDEGPGIPPEGQKHIWERFYRVTGVEVQSGTEVGLGLGLHICKMIIEQHGGQVGVHSAVGEGSTFWFTLPVARAGS